MSSKNLKKMVITAIAALVITGSASQIGFASQSHKAVAGVTSDSKENIENSIVGKIIAFEGNSVHVLAGDIPEIFQVSNKNLTSFYLGETVSVKKIVENKYELFPYKNSDFNIRYTTMGNPISNISGILKEINEDNFIISQGNADIKIQSGYKIDFEVGSSVSVDYTSFDYNSDNKVLLDIYNENTCLNLTVKEIGRSETGQMLITATDDAGKDFNVNVVDSCILFFNHSDLKVNDKITVYHDDVINDSTTVINGKMIKNYK